MNRQRGVAREYHSRSESVLEKQSPFFWYQDFLMISMGPLRFGC